MKKIFIMCFVCFIFMLISNTSYAFSDDYAQQWSVNRCGLISLEKKNLPVIINMTKVEAKELFADHNDVESALIIRKGIPFIYINNTLKGVYRETIIVRETARYIIVKKFGIPTTKFEVDLVESMVESIADEYRLLFQNNRV